MLEALTPDELRGDWEYGDDRETFRLTRNEIAFLNFVLRNSAPRSEMQAALVRRFSEYLG